ncbi:lactate dehydrogenase [Rufibacter sp. XAAS-G3-1]|uniref:lactate dehydrogenase n=1 Tax=Rufibacter sp. XAAS-G3-1 TaxID=2729134 RepID=UPI0015E7860F|nr:lactate dehydrogenase [Rufibacter sp. XAAS-G3-1]
MKVIAYGIRPSEKGLLAQANHKKHEITLISNPLSAETAFYAQGKEAVIVFAPSGVSGHALKVLAALGIRFIATRFDGPGPGSPGKGTAARLGILWANVTVPSTPGQAPSLEDLQRAAAQTIRQLDDWQLLA